MLILLAKRQFCFKREVEDAEEAIYNQDLTDMADLMVKIVKEAKKAEIESELE